MEEIFFHLLCEESYKIDTFISIFLKGKKSCSKQKDQILKS